MTKTIRLLLDHDDNLYQQLLLSEARVRAPRRNLELLEPLYANGSAVAQMEQLLQAAKGPERPDALLLVSAGRESQLPACRRAVKAGLSLVFLNRIPGYLHELRAENAGVLVAGVAPDQVAIGRIQAEQCRQLSPRGGAVLLVTGMPGSESARERRDGFERTLPPGTSLHVLEGDWSEASAYDAVSRWLRLGTDRSVAVTVCQNDQMARGARRALVEREHGDVPVLGCDGLPAEGQRLVGQGELVGTVVMPPTTGHAIDLLGAFWDHGARADVVLLEPDSHPPLSQIRSA